MSKNINETVDSTATVVTEEVIVEPTTSQKLLAFAKRLLLPVTAVIGTTAVLAVIDHHRRINELEGDVELLELEMYEGDDDPTEVIELDAIVDTEM